MSIKINKKGTTRFVILTNKFAIKIPKLGIFPPKNKFYGKTISFLNGWLANRYEYKWSKSGVYGFLCPIQYSFLFSIIIIMKRADPVSDEEFISLDNNHFNFGGYEHKADSYGKINNKLVIVDYGN